MKNRTLPDPRLRHLPDPKITAEEATYMAGVGLFHIKLIMISGLVWMALGFESVVMRFVTSFLSCSWEIEIWQGAILDAVTLFSTILGCILYGIWSDKYGRKTAFYSVPFLFIFGVLSAASPNFNWFVIFRAVAAFSVGGLYQTLVLCLETFPGNKRGQVVYTLATFWALSVLVMQHVLFSTMMKGHSWRMFVTYGTVPALLASCLIRFYPGSFRYQMVMDKYAAANDIIAKMLKGNGKKMTAQLLQLPQMRPRKLVLDFFRRPLVRSSILLWILGLLTSICHRGLVDLPHHSQADYPPRYDTLKIMEHGFSKVPSTHYMHNTMSTSIGCIKFINMEEFIFLTWTTALDFPAFVIYLIMVDLINRKILLTASYVLSAACCFVLFALYAVPEGSYFAGYSTLFIAFSYCTRTLLLAQHDLILLIVAEAFPTSHRGTAVGLEVAIFYLGQFLGYLILLGLLRALMLYSLFLYGALLLLCSIPCWRKLDKTMGKELEDIVQNPPDVYFEEN